MEKGERETEGARELQRRGNEKRVIIRFSSKDQLVMRRRGGGEGETEGRDRRRALECWRRFLQAFNKHHLEREKCTNKTKTNTLWLKSKLCLLRSLLTCIFPPLGKADSVAISEKGKSRIMRRHI